MKEKRRVPLWILPWLVAVIAGTLYAMESVAVSVPFVMGKIDIQVKQYGAEDGEEIAWEQVDPVLPGQYVSWIPRIHNEGESCYVRAKVSVFEEGKEGQVPDDFSLKELNSGWQKASDGYFYYQKILGREETVELFRGIKVSEDLPQEQWEDREITFGIRVEAIQTQQMEPDFSSPMPWGTVKIMEYQKDNETEIVYVEPVEKSFQIIYRGDKEQWQTREEGLFSEVSCFMPGGIYQDELTVINEDSRELLLHIGSGVTEASEWLDQVGLSVLAVIDGEETVLYEGNLTMSGVSETLLQKIPGRGQMQILFEIRVPENFDNGYVAEQPQIQWTIYGEPVTNLEQGKWNEPEHSPQSSGGAKTGDSCGLEWILIGIAVSLAVITYGSFMWQRGRKQDE